MLRVDEYTSGRLDWTDFGAAEGDLGDGLADRVGATLRRVRARRVAALCLTLFTSAGCAHQADPALPADRPAQPNAASVKPAPAKNSAPVARPARRRSFDPHEETRTNEEIEIQGQFSSRDPAMLGRIWRVGRDARTCDQAQLQALLYQQAIPDLLAHFEATNADDRRPWQEILQYEIGITDALVFAGRYADSEQFLKKRAAKKIYSAAYLKGMDGSMERGFENHRHVALIKRLADLYAETRPDEAERLYEQAVQLSSDSFRELFEGQTHGYPKGGTVWQHENREFVLRTAAMRARILGPFYEGAGRYWDAVNLYQAARAPKQASRDAMSNPGDNGEFVHDIAALDASIALAKARIAHAEGRLSDAEALYRLCCFPSGGWSMKNQSRYGRPSEALPALARLLLHQGRPAEARVVALRLKLEVANDIEKAFKCMAVAAKPSSSNDEAIEDAKGAARKALPEGYGSGGQHSKKPAGFVLEPFGGLPETGRLLARGTELGVLLVECGLFEDADQVLRPTFSLQQTIFGTSHPSALQTLAALAGVQRRLGQTANGADSWSTWISQSSEFIGDRLWDVNEDARREFLRADRTNVARCLGTLVAAGRPDLAAQVLAVSLGRKGLQARLAGEISLLARGAADAATRRLVLALVQQRQHVAALASASKGTTPEAVLARRKLNDLEVQLAAVARSGRAPNEALTSRSLMDALPADAALVDFQVFQDPDADLSKNPYGSMVAVIARRGVDPVLVSWPDVSGVRIAAAGFRNAILSGADLDSERELKIASSTDAFYAKLWAPLESHLREVRQINIVPDGFLNVVPLRALRDREGRYLIQSHQLAQFGSARDLSEAPVFLRHRTALVVGAPDYGQGDPAQQRGTEGGRTVGRGLGELRFTSLPGALEESKQVATILSRDYASELLTGARATKSAVLRADGPAILHLATHGFFLVDVIGSTDEGDPIRSLSRAGLALAHANREIVKGSSAAANSGILTALEAASLDLRGTRLVVLSACDTGLGQVEVGEGVYGLARAFHEAGSRAVLATLWPVADKATGEFMKRLYRRIVAGQPVARALDETQIEMLQTAEWRDPKFWAPFVLTGR